MIPKQLQAGGAFYCATRNEMLDSSNSDLSMNAPIAWGVIKALG